jgi:hypothetical protein
MLSRALCALRRSFRGPGGLGALALVGIEQGLPEADRSRRHLDEFVVVDVGERAFSSVIWVREV